MSIFYWARTLAILSLSAAVVAIVQNHNPLAAQESAANDRFKDIAVAVSEGNAPIPCVSGADGAISRGAFADTNPSVSCEHAHSTK